MAPGTCLVHSPTPTFWMTHKLALCLHGPLFSVGLKRKTGHLATNFGGQRIGLELFLSQVTSVDSDHSEQALNLVDPKVLANVERGWM